CAGANLRFPPVGSLAGTRLWAASCRTLKAWLEERSDRLSVDAQADYLRAVVDLLDRVRRDEAAASGQEAEANRERVGRVRRGAVHRGLDPSDDPALRVCHEEAGGAPQIES